MSMPETSLILPPTRALVTLSERTTDTATPTPTNAPPTERPTARMPRLLKSSFSARSLPTLFLMASSRAFAAVLSSLSPEPEVELAVTLTLYQPFSKPSISAAR